jgi:hypothetical protein
MRVYAIVEASEGVSRPRTVGIELARTACMKAPLLAGLLALTSASAFAQQTSIAPGDIRCPDCALTGQQPAATAFDASQVKFVANPIPAFHENQTFRQRLVARVVNASPLMLEMLDNRFQMVDRSMKIIERGGPDREPKTCLGPQRIPVVDLASRPVVETLRLNDIITGDQMMQRSAKMPDAILMGTQVLTNVRKASGPVPLTTMAGDKRCGNSGMLIQHWMSGNGKATIVYNDGTLFHRNAVNLSFDQERLSPAELSDLLRAFGEAQFDSLPTEFPQETTFGQPSLTLIGARYQRVALKDGDARLAPVVKRLDALADRSMSQARYILKRDDPLPLVVRPWPYPDVDLDKLTDHRNLSSKDAPQAWSQPMPNEFLASLPGDYLSREDRLRDPNRALHFSHAGRLYRVARSTSCAGANRECPFRFLKVAEVAEPASGECTLGVLGCGTQIFPDGRQVTKRVDPELTRQSGRLWPRAVSVRLRDVPSGGMTIAKAEYDRHNEIYFPLLEWRLLGAPFIEDGLIYENVRVCQIDRGADATCEITPPWTPPVK